MRTYRRRGVTRESGYHTCEGTTGGECLILHAQRYVCSENTAVFEFVRPSVDLIELFGNGIGMIAFGGYVYAARKASVSLEMCYSYEGQEYAVGERWEKIVEEGT